MRDPKRIKPILNLIESIWNTYPDLRLGQLLTIVTPLSCDLFSVEDDDLVKNIKISFAIEKGTYIND